ncbi:GNAT family N-acetyltransferase [Streptomyces ficellus]|uniref:GNAT family N-acetyltransferase n=1 Tax=Streptomyces ficellus TaxID=1977088 RepID=A0A6I6FUS9_9ACTN|nr:GNAT family N-acetyltransferase [Streptomyces ficellus]QGV81266.1 GNAT family N-acetyltransferase [Streptomyces ficellus]
MIRHATLQDLDAIAALHQEARATYYRGHLPDADFEGPAELARSRQGWAAAVDRGNAVLCAEADGELVGVAAFRPVDGTMSLTQLHVAPAHWRRGTGTRLHAACVAAWRAAGVTTARLEVFEHNERAHAFYTRHGWLPDPVAPRSGNHLVLRLALTAP